MITLINDILDFSKIEAGKLELEQVDFDLRAAVLDVIRLITVQAQAKHIAIDVDWDAALPEWVSGDPTRTRQILLNLCSNAVKFTESGGVRVSVRPATAARNHTERTPTGISFAVHDSGPGIPAHRLDSLFSPFVQVDASTTRRYGGTGLGLSIVKQLVELMGGEVGVDTREAEGSTFWFNVPFRQATSRIPAMEPAGRRVTPSPPPSSSPWRLLVADDHPVNQKVAARTLEKLGYSVDVVADGLAAVAAWETGRYDLILLDCEMPEMDGYDTCREIRRREAGRVHIPIIALTANASPGAEASCRDAGMDDFLTKPMDRQRLNVCLEQLLPKVSESLRIEA